MVERAYGDILADQLGYDYLHEARACGSNTRIWRKVTNHIVNGQLQPGDKVLIQYTEITRNEFATWIDPIASLGINEKFDKDTWLVRFKLDAHLLHSDKHATEWLRTYLERWLCIPYEEERFKFNHHMFQCMLAYHNIDAYFLNLSCYAPPDHIWETIPYFTGRVFTDNHTLHNQPWGLSTEDPWHLSPRGHEKVADDVYQFIQGDRQCAI
jgi:hypothetical protein